MTSWRERSVKTSVSRALSPDHSTMSPASVSQAVTPLVLESRHTGERLALLRVERNGETWLSIKGSLPAGSQGPPLHLHVDEDEEGEVVAGTLGAIVGDREIRAHAGERVFLPRGVPHRWWNAGDDLLVFEGWAKPANDLDRYLQAIFEIANASPTGRPSLVYFAHLALRHRRSQRIAGPPAVVQAILFRVVVAVGTLLGRYREANCPEVQPAEGRRYATELSATQVSKRRREGARGGYRLLRRPSSM